MVAKLLATDPLPETLRNEIYNKIVTIVQTIANVKRFPHPR